MSKNLKGIYLASFKAYHPGHDIIYQDINGKRDIGGDMLDIDLSDYDYIIATPPCNWWSRANYRRNVSEYALQTKHLLIDIIDKLIKQDKPFIIENVRNDSLFTKYGLFNNNLFILKIGRHTYWTNTIFKYDDIHQFAKTDFVNGKKIWLSSQNLARSLRQGCEEVHEVIERFILQVEYNKLYE